MRAAEIAAGAPEVPPPMTTTLYSPIMGISVCSLLIVGKAELTGLKPFNTSLISPLIFNQLSLRDLIFRRFNFFFLKEI